MADAINIHAQQGSVETVRLNGRRFDCGSWMNTFQLSHMNIENVDQQTSSPPKYYDEKTLGNERQYLDLTSRRHA